MNQKKKVYFTIGVLSIILIVIGISYAYWKLNVSQSGTNEITTQCFKLIFEEDKTSNISVLEGYPMSDEDGSKLTPYTFKVSNGCTVKAKYDIRLELENTTTMNEIYVKSMLNNNAIKKVSELNLTTPSLSNATKSYVLSSETINAGETKNYSIRLWIDGGVSSDNKEVMDKIFSAKVTLDGDYDSSYTESILNGTDPELKDNLMPVTIESDGTVKKADITKEWYRYENKVWANAVILEDETKTYDNTEVIPESNIESYFVWIPRYKYQIFDNGLYNGLSPDTYTEKSQAIQIVFENRETKISKGTKKGDWLTHPAFTSFDSNGMWVGKFETGYKGATTTTEAQQNVVDTTKVQIKPNVYSWRYLQPANQHLNSYNYQRNLDSHLMKNTEWGAVAYLSHSIYGSMTDLRINNNSAHITGYSGVSEPSCIQSDSADCNRYESTNLGVDGTYTINYFNSASVLSSTTGNYSGIYDMSGGSYESVFGVMANQNGVPVSGRNTSGNSGFNGPFSYPDDDGITRELTTGIDFPEAKYYDLYAYSENIHSFFNRILGDATGELGPFTIMRNTDAKTSWYNDYNMFVYQRNPWVDRGSGNSYGISAGLFTTGYAHGGADSVTSYRIVLTPGGNL